MKNRTADFFNSASLVLPRGISKFESYVFFEHVHGPHSVGSDIVKPTAMRYNFRVPKGDAIMVIDKRR